jgi:hypothetical protein
MHLRHGASMAKRIARSPLGEAHGQLILISVAGILVGSQAYAGEAGDSGYRSVSEMYCYAQVDPSSPDGA